MRRAQKVVVKVSAKVFVPVFVKMPVKVFVKVSVKVFVKAVKYYERKKLIYVDIYIHIYICM